MKTAFALCLAALPLVASAAAPLTLVDFSPPFDAQAVTVSDATATVVKSGAGTALRVAAGHQKSWPGVTLKAPQDHWDLAAYGQLTVSVRNPGTNKLTVNCRVDNPGADGTKNCVTASVGVDPGKTAQLQVGLSRTVGDKLDGKLFGMRGYPVKAGGQGSLDPKNITQLLFFINQPKQDCVFEVAQISASGEFVPPTAWTSDASPFFPFIDPMGQYLHKDWPGKTRAVADLPRNREAEARDLAAHPGPKGWDQYGGSTAGPTLKATGFFRTEKVRGKWWLVDPEGHLFFSHGVDCVRMIDATPIEERETWFKDFPGAQPEFASFLSQGFALKGHYQGRTVKCFSFASANLYRKYGPEWRTNYPPVVQTRLRSWGINTIANWSDMGVAYLRRTPYTDNIGTGRTKNIEGSEGYWGKFPDVFDPSFEESVRRAAASKTGRSASDPWCIGYFSDNEMSWGDELSLALAALKSPPEQAAKLAILSDLKTKYGTIARLNQAWGTQHESWDALLADRKGPDKEKARPDLEAFYTRAAERYFKIVRDGLRAVAPNQLYLGCRFAWVNPRAAAAAAKYCDVVSYNLYQRSVANFVFNGGADVPLIIGEFHFGALDRGMFHTGLVPVASQAARAQAYKDYVLGALRHPQFVGTHWFQYQDEPTLGRTYDEENYQIGFVDIADTPYREMIEATREVGARLYQEGSPAKNAK
jgi:hypothetical protein